MSEIVIFSATAFSLGIITGMFISFFVLAFRFLRNILML
jgi:hypothetical protein